MMDLLEKFLFPIYQASILAAVGLYFFNRKRYRLGCCLLTLGAGWLLLCSTPLLANCLYEPLKRQYPMKDPGAYARADVVVILGGGSLAWDDSHPDADNPYGQTTRIGFGLELFREKRASTLLISGSDQARSIAAKLLQQGVPAAALQVEGASTNTHENAQLSAAILKPEKRLHILLVTSGFHMPRAAGAFAKQGLQVTAASAHDPVYASWIEHPWWPSRAALRLTGRCMHEYLALWWYRQRDWI